MKAVVAAFNQEKALVGAFSMITNFNVDLRLKLYWLAEMMVGVYGVCHLHQLQVRVSTREEGGTPDGTVSGPFQETQSPAPSPATSPAQPSSGQRKESGRS